MHDLYRRVSFRLKHKTLGMRRFERPFVFNIGLPKTATTSLHAALQILGYRAINYPPIAIVEDNECRLEWPWWMENFDAGGDIPVAATYRALHDLFPNAIFLMTVRDKDAWLASCWKHFTEERAADSRDHPRFRQNHALNEYVFGTAIFDRTAFSATYDRHIDGAIDFFANRKKLTVLNVQNDGAWDTLCAAVGSDVPRRAFPKKNTRASKGAPKVDAN